MRCVAEYLNHPWCDHFRYLLQGYLNHVWTSITSEISDTIPVNTAATGNVLEKRDSFLRCGNHNIWQLSLVGFKTNKRKSFEINILLEKYCINCCSNQLNKKNTLLALIQGWINPALFQYEMVADWMLDHCACFCQTSRRKRVWQWGIANISCASKRYAIKFSAK